MHASLGELVLDLVRNSAEAGATRVEVRWSEVGEALVIVVTDDGRGMDASAVARATSPFTTEPGKHPGRTVGLGLAFLRQTAEATRARMILESVPGSGTKAGIAAPRGHVDLPADDDPVDALVAVLCTEELREIVIERETDAGRYTLTKSELESVLGDLTTVAARSMLATYVRSQEDGIWRR